MKKFIKEPLLHFCAIGVLLFALNAWRGTKQPSEENGPRIEVNAATIERLRAGYERQFGQVPDAEELRGLVTAHIREEVLCREAIALGLDRDDTIVRRRLAQKMEFLTAHMAGAVAPDETAVRDFFAAHSERYVKPGWVSFRHVYFSKEKRGPAVKASATEALSALKKGASDESMGDAFLHGFVFAEREREEVAMLFGPDLARQLEAQAVGSWEGPLTSSYGLHLVRVEARSGPRPMKLEMILATVERDLNEERRSTMNREIFERLCERYEVEVDEVALAKASGTRTAQR
jgi:peptidyl-prolyl cis-trans isomerase C